MGFWYFLILFIGIFLMAMAFIKRSINVVKKLPLLLLGVCMITFSLFMFQDGSAEIVDNLLKSFNINLWKLYVLKNILKQTGALLKNGHQRKMSLEINFPAHFLCVFLNQPLPLTQPNIFTMLFIY